MVKPAWRARALLVTAEARLKSGTATAADLSAARAAGRTLTALGAAADAVDGFLVTGRLAATVDSYIAAAHPCPEPGHKLFHTGDPSKPADKSTVYNRFRRYLADADIPHFPGGPHIHSLRHGFAVANLRRWAADGADLVVMLPYLSAYMGHADLRGTQYYLQLTADAHPEVAAMASARFGYVIPGPADPPQGARQ